MRIRLIFPKGQSHNFWDPKTSVFLTGKKYSSIPLSLPTIAALCPPDSQVKIIDENIEEINYDEEIDLVGISFFTAFADRAYEIADNFRKRNIKVVLGGIHATALPNEALQHADSIVVGEADETWLQLINDFRNKKLRPFYRSERKPELDILTVPRWDLVNIKNYNFFTIQATRGCPFNCEFCSVSNFFGRGIRHKPINHVLEEIKFLKSIIGNKTIVFADDNFIGNPEYAKNLIRALIKEKIDNWWCQTSINLAENKELLELMAESKCKQVFIGFESLSQDSLNYMNKGRVNIAENFLEAVNKIHSYRISVFGSFILGYDGDKEDIFHKTVEFINNTNIAFALVGLLVPFPDTRLYYRLKKEGRIITEEWYKYNGEFVCFKPKNMSAKTLAEGHRWVLKKLYSYNSLQERLKNLWEKKILTKDYDNNFYSRLSKKKIEVFLKALSNRNFRKDKKRINFLFRNLFDKNNPRFFSIFSAIDFHDVVDEYLKINNDNF